jgi:hypothetical protein
MGLRSFSLLCFVCAGLLLAGPSAAIVNGQLDGSLHPEVGALVAEDIRRRRLNRRPLFAEPSPTTRDAGATEIEDAVVAAA